MFQSTHPRRVWPEYTMLRTHALSFNPHTHEGCDTRTWSLQYDTLVSIHTPTKGVTRSILVHGTLKGVSIHTPTKGVTIAAFSSYPSIKVSIHTPTKGVTCCWWLDEFIESVSIHTPTKGVTWYTKQFRVSDKVSIHTPTKGVTLFHRKILTPNLFQSTHPRRVWLNIFREKFW